MAKIRGVVSVVFSRRVIVDIHTPKCPLDDPSCCTERGKCKYFHGLTTIDWLPVVHCEKAKEDDLQP